MNRQLTELVPESREGREQRISQCRRIAKILIVVTIIASVVMTFPQVRNRPLASGFFGVVAAIGLISTAMLVEVQSLIVNRIVKDAQEEEKQ